MPNLDTSLRAADQFQQRHRFLAIGFAVMRKYGDDKAGYLAALLTYYGFLAIFPLLLAATSIIQIALAHNLPLAHEVSAALVNIFPNFGLSLQDSVHVGTKTGLGLVIGIVVALFGARGVADALRHAIDEVWEVPRSRRLGFPAEIVSSLQIIIVGGGGFILASVVSTFVQGTGSQLWIVILANLMSAAVIYLTLMAVFLIAKPKGLHRADMRHGAVATAVALQLLQLLGGALVAHQLHNLNAVYGVFAVVLGLLFYLYLQAQILMYALVYNVVIRRHLWPRSLTQQPSTPEDKAAFTAQAQKEEMVPHETVKVKFKD